MIVVWSKRAHRKRLDTYDYIYQTFGKKAAADFEQQLRWFTDNVVNNPGMGRPEPLLKESSIPFQSYVINELNTIVYYITGSFILIADLWDSRRLPANKTKGL